MQELKNNSHKDAFRLKNLPLDEKERLIGAFVWLIEEDKKQNPALYQTNKTKKYELENTI